MGLLPHSSSSNGVLVSFFILPYHKYILTYFYIYISIVIRNGFCYWVRSYDWKRLLVSFLFPPYIKTSWPFGQLISSYFYYSLLIQWDYLESIVLLHLLQPDPLRSLFRKCLQVSLPQNVNTIIDAFSPDKSQPNARVVPKNTRNNSTICGMIRTISR